MMEGTRRDEEPELRTRLPSTDTTHETRDRDGVPRDQKNPDRPSGTEPAEQQMMEGTRRDEEPELRTRLPNTDTTHETRDRDGVPRDPSRDQKNPDRASGTEPAREWFPENDWKGTSLDEAPASSAETERT